MIVITVVYPESKVATFDLDWGGGNIMGTPISSSTPVARQAPVRWCLKPFL